MPNIRPLLLAAAAAVLSAAVTFAQTGGSLTARPDRGASIGGAYSSSGVDNVSLTGGGLNVSIPLASLPPIAGGKLGLTITATYNSKLWDVGREEGRAPGTIGRMTYVVDVPRLSKRGGWRVGAGYEIEKRDAHEDFDYDQPQQFETTQTDWPWVQNNRNWYRLYLITPDGAEHELVPSEGGTFYAGFERTYLNGSFSDTPGGLPTRYHTVDGSYVSVVYNSQADWTVTLPDGTQATHSAEGQRIRDTNGNSILIYNGADGATHYKDVQSGREIRVTGDMASGYQVWYHTVGDNTPEQHVDVNTGATVVQGKFYRVNDWNSSVQAEDGSTTGSQCVKGAILDTGVNGASNPLHLAVVRGIVFPATEPGQPGRSFTFSYNSDATESFTTNYSDVCGQAPAPVTTTSSKGLGELSRMQTPTGAVFEYAYSLDGTHLFQINLDTITRDMVTTRKVGPEGAAETDKDRWTYDINVLGGGGTVTNPDGTSAQETAYIQDPGYSSKSGGPNGLGGKVFSSRSGNVLVQHRWRSNPGGLALSAPSGAVAVNPLVEAEFTSLIENNAAVRMSAKTFQYDLNGNLLQTKEYDWFDPAAMTRDGAGIPQGEPPASALLRQTDTSYYNSAADLSSTNLYSKRATSGTTLVINVPKETVTGASVTRFRYDGQAFEQPPNKGNVTQVESFDDQGDDLIGNDRWVTTKTTYDPTYGNVTSITDANDNVTHFYYEDDTHALPTKVEVDPLNGTGVQTTLTTYDFRTGLVLSTTDANGQTTNIDYTNQLLDAPDPFGRPGVMTGPAVMMDGVSQRRKVYTTYEDELRRVTVESDLRAGGDRLLKSRTTSDELGRPVLSEQSEDGASYTVFTRSAYEQGRRVSYSSNPMRAGASATDGWTRVTRDTAGRVKEVATFAGAARPTATAACDAASGCTGRVTTDYYAEFTTVTDQAGRARRSRTDGLGRLVRVDEPSGEPTAQDNMLGGYDSPTQPTAYTYDVLGNLTLVRQGGQVQLQNGQYQYVGGQARAFTYSSLARLALATNPESGTASYEYDGAGNLKKKTDPRLLPDGVTHYSTTYGYDGFNRVESRAYNDGTPEVTYCYDKEYTDHENNVHQVSNAKGRLTQVRSSVSIYTYTGYDTLGRVTGSQQAMPNGDGTYTVYSMPEYKYDLIGNLTSEQYPSGRVVKTEYDAAGRVAGVKNQATGLYYAGGAATSGPNDRIQYTAGGAAAAVRLGNGLWEHTDFNSRLQPSQIRLGTVTDNSSVLRLDYAYGVVENGALNVAKNNSNPQSQTINVPTMTPAVQTYVYDELNRLKSAEEKAGTTSTWKQVYSYDRYGNRTLAAETTYPAQLNTTNNPAVSQQNNRITSAGYVYDAAGNLQCDVTHQCLTGGETSAPNLSVNIAYFDYDAENRIVRAGSGGAGYGEGGSSYTYDGDGWRVRKAVTGGEVTAFVYDALGRVVAEYSNQVEAKGTRYLTQDNLGSTRVITDAQGNAHTDPNTGAAGSRHDYYPFGEEIAAGGGREASPALGYNLSSVRQKFIGKERDYETGLDYLGARYYSSSRGLFSSPDPFSFQQEMLADPQRFNLYAYVRNNPLTFIDPTGMIIDTSRLTKDELEKWQKVLAIINAKNDKGEYVNKELRATYERLDSDKQRTFFIENKDFKGRGAVGEFNITKHNGKDDFTEAVIQIDFEAVEHLENPQQASLVPGFNRYGGLIGETPELRAELFGHEGGHGVYALDHLEETVTLQILKDARDKELTTTKHPYPPDLLQRIKDVDDRIIPTERYAQQNAQAVNAELQAYLKDKNKKK
jgi:RHS repeat-associated protein